MNTPNMYPEVLEAIYEAYKNDKDIEVDCYIYLSSLTNDKEKVNQLSIAASNALERNNRCIYCGAKLEYYTYKQPHYELEEKPTETITVPYCPECDRKGYIQ